MVLARLNDLDIDYSLVGDELETVVLVAGLADTQDGWSSQVPALLEAGFRVLTFDNRGAGGSSAPPGPYTTLQLAEDTKALVDHLGISGFHLVGHSMGGAIAQEYALTYPRDLRSLTLSSTCAAFEPHASHLARLWAELANLVGVATVMRESMLWSLTPRFYAERPEDVMQAETILSEYAMTVEAFRAQVEACLSHDATARLGAIEIPTLVLAAESDILIPGAVSAKLHDLIPGAEWASVPGGHVSPYENAAEYNSILIKFVRAHGDR